MTLVGLALAGCMVTFGIFLILSETRAVAERRAIRLAIEVALQKADARDDAKREEMQAEIARILDASEARAQAEREAILKEFRAAIRPVPGGSSDRPTLPPGPARSPDGREER